VKERGIDVASVTTPADPARALDPAKLRDDDVIETGGLHIIGSERHESRRIDRQLRGRAGRQGDPGASQFFLSLEDDLMRLFGSDRIASVMDRMGAEEGEVISHSLITRSIGNAQKRVEMQNFEARKRLLDYDDVMNQQREVIYDLRTFALEGGEDLKGEAWDMVEKTVGRLIDEYAPEGAHPEDWDVEGLRARLELDFFFIADRLPRDGEGVLDLRSRDELEEYLVGMAREKFRAQLAQFGDHSEDLLRYVVLSTIDERWKDHLYDLDGLKASIGFRGWGQKDPLIEYKQEAYEMFVGLMTDIHSSIARLVFRARLEVTPMPALPQMPLMYTGPELDGYMETAAGEDTSTGPAQRPADAERSSGLGVNPRMAVRPPQPPVDPRRLATNRDETPRPPAASAPEVGRNDPCPCGSGKKYKKCHGAGLV
jgi:preprotein translocase subunit SecA